MFHETKIDKSYGPKQSEDLELTGYPFKCASRYTLESLLSSCTSKKGFRSSNVSFDKVVSHENIQIFKLNKLSNF